MEVTDDGDKCRIGVGRSNCFSGLPLDYETFRKPSLDVLNDDSYTGRGSVERRRRDLGLRRCDLVAVEQKFNTD